MFKHLIFTCLLLLFFITAIELVATFILQRPETFSIFSEQPEKQNTFNSLILDEDGIYRHNEGFVDSIKSSLSTARPNQTKDAVQIYFSLSYYAQLYDIHNRVNKLSGKYLESLKKELSNDYKNGGYLSYKEKIYNEYDSIKEFNLFNDIKLYTQSWINDSGFRSISFKNYSSHRKKIMLLGDSFTYGISSMPLYKSFSDLILLEGHLTYNGGIPGTNVINYYSVAQKYIPQIKPNYVITFYFPVNDHINFPWDSTNHSYKPGQSINNVWFPSVINSEYLPQKEEWLSTITHCLESKLPFTFLRPFLTYHLFINRFYDNKIKQCFPDPNYIDVEMTHFFLKKIDLVCKQNNSVHFIIIIPPFNFDMEKFKKESDNTLFENIKVFYPLHFTAEDYKISLGDPHFNNNGHQKMKEYIIKIIEESEL